MGAAEPDRRASRRPGCDGVVVTHGTDTLEERPISWRARWRREKPVVFTGAMRSASDLGWDGPRTCSTPCAWPRARAARQRDTRVHRGAHLHRARGGARRTPRRATPSRARGSAHSAKWTRAGVLPSRAAQCAAPLEPGRPRSRSTSSRLGGRRRAAAGRVARERCARRGDRRDGPGQCAAAGVRGDRALAGGGRPGVDHAHVRGAGESDRPTGYPGGGRRLHEIGAIFADGKRPGAGAHRPDACAGSRLRPSGDSGAI